MSKTAWQQLMELVLEGDELLAVRLLFGDGSPAGCENANGMLLSPGQAYPLMQSWAFYDSELYRWYDDGLVAWMNRRVIYSENYDMMISLKWVPRHPSEDGTAA